MKCFVVLAVFGVVLSTCDPTRASPTRVRRQGWTWGNEGDSGDFPVESNPPPTPPPPTQPPNGNDGNFGGNFGGNGGGGNPGNLDPNASTTTVAPVAYTRCFNECPTTQQYNPVCGTNRVTYTNAGLLNCARRCGLDIQLMFNGACEPL